MDPVLKTKFAIQSAFKDCLDLRQKESCLVVADTPMQEIAKAFYDEAQRLSKSSLLMIIPPVHEKHKEPSKGLAALMSESDVVLLITSRSLSHTRARRKACKNGTRIVSLPNISRSTLERGLNGDYKEIVTLSRKIADILTIGRQGRLTTPSGTDLTFSLSRVKGRADTGMVHEPGQFSNLPFGEGCAGPVQGSAQGVLVVDGSFPGIGKIDQPVKLTVKDGYAVRISGGEEAIVMRRMLRPFGKPGKNIAEIGIGTNPHAKFTGMTLEDEKVKGTVHVALGNNLSFDGKIDAGCHFDAVLLKPTLVIDGKAILDNGQLQV